MLSGAMGTVAANVRRSNPEVRNRYKNGGIMGRELKRVALDFDWPTGKVWKGFINPHDKPCPEKGRTCFNGENAAALYLSHITSMLTVIGDDARRGATHPYCNDLPYYGAHPDWSIQPKEIRQRMVDLITNLTGGKPSGLGFGGSGHTIFFKLLEIAGIKNPPYEDSDAYKEAPKPAYEWTQCPICKGENLDPAVKEEYDAWKDYEPPKGEGFQLWETTSEGSPISPVFKTLDELCVWAEKNATTFGDNRASAEQWKKMLDDGLVCHREGNMIFL